MFGQDLGDTNDSLKIVDQKKSLNFDHDKFSPWKLHKSYLSSNLIVLLLKMHLMKVIFLVSCGRKFSTKLRIKFCVSLRRLLDLAEIMLTFFFERIWVILSSFPENLYVKKIWEQDFGKA